MTSSFYFSRSQVFSCPPKIFFLEYSLILKDVVEVLRRYGHNLYGLHPRSVTVTSFVKTCMQYDADWVFGINFSPGAYLCSRVGIPYVSWTIDPISSERYKLIEGTNTKMCICFAHDIRTVAKFRDLGIDAQHMFLAAPGIRRKPITDKNCYSIILVTRVLLGIRWLMKSWLLNII